MGCGELAGRHYRDGRDGLEQPEQLRSGGGGAWRKTRQPSQLG